MKRLVIGLSAALLLTAGGSSLSADVNVGSYAPPVKPREWLNSPHPVSWNSLQGRVILLEKWATT